jgi:dTDP-4-amino-4,6-dideoxygalactose transaminase
VGKVRLPQAETLAAEVVSLPVHPSLSEDDLAWIVRSVQAILA